MPASNTDSERQTGGGRFVELPGRKLWVEDSGGYGVPVVFLHSATGSILLWEKQRQAVAAAGYRFIAYDRLGASRSELLPGAAIGTAVDDLEALVKALRLDRLHLV